jgi:hypothetical protein
LSRVNRGGHTESTDQQKKKKLTILCARPRDILSAGSAERQQRLSHALLPAAYRWRA